MTIDVEKKADDTLNVLAFYVVIDVSVSMAASGALAEANMILPKVVDAVSTQPTLADVVRLGVIDFSDDARVVLRLGDLRDVDHIPQCVERGGTSYAAAFDLLRKEIESDVQQLKGDGFKVFRPAVFFITDGEPTDEPQELRQAFEQLTDANFRARPNIILFGLGAATKDVLEPWVFPKEGAKRPMRSYVAKEGVDPKQAITKIAEALVASIIASAQSVDDSGQQGGFVPPDDEDLDDWL